MELNAITKAKLKTIAYTSLIGTVIGILFVISVYGYHRIIIAEGALIGFLITCGSSVAEIFFFSDKNKTEKFRYVILKRTAFYIGLISFATLLVLFVFDSIEKDLSIWSAIRSRYVLNFLKYDFIIIFFFSVLVSFIINFFRQIIRVLGAKVILNMLIGRYRRPSAENRIFVFLDLKSSTEIGENLGAAVYSELLQDFFMDIANPVEETAGEIYQYVGDEVVLTWKIEEAEKNDNCIDCFFMIRDKVQSRKSYYADKYGIVPDFKAGIHAGKSIVTEVGDLQKEIVYHGDVLNTASRIQKECNNLNASLLVSNALVNQIEIDENKYKVESIGYFFLKGKTRGIELLSVWRTKDKSLPLPQITPRSATA